MYPFRAEPPCIGLYREYPPPPEFSSPFPVEAVCSLEVDRHFEREVLLVPVAFVLVDGTAEDGMQLPL